MMRFCGIGRWLIVVLLPLCAAHAATGQDYRLAGTLSGGDGRWIAFIELPAGGQRVVRVNDRLGNGTIVAISDRRVRIAFPGGERELRLGGSDHATAAQRLAAAEPTEIATVHADQRLLAALRAAEQAAVGKDAAFARIELNRLFGLPAETRVSRVRSPETGFAPAAEGAALFRTLHTRLARGQLVQLFLDGVSTDEIYVMPPQRRPGRGS